MAIFSKGTVLTQYKEPAFSRNVVRFVSPKADALPEEVIPDRPVDALTGDELIAIARAAGIVDERDGRMLYRKLELARGRVAAVIADAIDDEPYVSSQIGPMLKLREDACGGLSLCERVVQSGNAFIMAYKNLADLETRIPRTLEGYPVVRLRGGYPAESRSTRRMLRAGRRLFVGAGALIHFYRAVTRHIRQTTVFVTVAGGCVANPMNLEVTLGMSVMQLLERCGLLYSPTRVVLGGPMTGLAILDPDRTLVTPTTRAVLAFRDRKADRLYQCIGCGRCEQVCPAGLNPMYIYRFVQNRYFANLEPFDAHLCVGCGTCSYVCPSKLGVANAAGRARQYALDHFITPAEGEDEL